MTTLNILGAGGHGRVVADAAEASGSWHRVVFFDDRVSGKSGRWEVVGDSLAFAKCAGDRFIGIGDARARLEWLHRLTVDAAVVVHPSAVVAPDVTLGSGTFVAAGAVLNTGVRIGVGVIANTGAVVDHDCVLSDGVHVCPGVALAGGVSVGARSWVGIGSCVIQNVRIGAGVTVGAGAAVVGDVADGLTVVGVPARPLRG